MEGQNEQLKEAIKKAQSIEEMTGELISDYYKLKLALTQIKSELSDIGGFEIQIAYINEILNNVQ